MRYAALLVLMIASHAVLSQTWKLLQPDNECTNRHENSLAAVGDKIILLGGRGVKPVEVYDIKTNSWTKLIETPLEISHFQAITYKNEVWVLNAFTGSYPHETPIPDVYIFNLEKNEWRKGPSIPEDRQRGSGGAFVYRDKIYMVCGEIDGHWDGTVAWLDEYDPKTNTWKTLPDAPHVRDHVGAAVVGDKLYLAGGRRSSAKTNQVLSTTEAAVDVYDFKTGKWTTLDASLNLPTLRGGPPVVVWNDKVVVLGGESDKQQPSHSEAEAFNPSTMKWEKLANMNIGRHGTGAVNVAGKIYIIAGSGNRGGGPELNSIEVFGED